MTRTLVALVAALALAPATVGAGEARFEERDGVLYVTATATLPPPAPGRAVARAVARRNAGDAVKHLIRQAAERHAVAPLLVESVIRVESNFEPRAVSPKGARGLMQLMPATAKLLGVRDVFDVRENIEAGVRHLRTLLDRYGGNVTLALAAYNAGVEAVARFGGVPPFPETQTYVAKILALAGGGVLAAPVEVTILHRYETSDGVAVYSNIPKHRLTALERETLDRRP